MSRQRRASPIQSQPARLDRKKFTPYPSWTPQRKSHPLLATRNCITPESRSAKEDLHPLLATSYSPPVTATPLPAYLLPTTRKNERKCPHFFARLDQLLGRTSWTELHRRDPACPPTFARCPLRNSKFRIQHPKFAHLRNLPDNLRTDRRPACPTRRMDSRRLIFSITYPIFVCTANNLLHDARWR